jgi:hypothetical protein
MLVPGENFEIRIRLPSLLFILSPQSLWNFLSFFQPLVFPFILLTQVKLISHEIIQHTHYSRTLPGEFQNMHILNAHLANTSVTCAVGPSVTTSSTDFSFQNLVFRNLFEFSAAEIT